jgi:hypothetical protein
MSTLKVTHLQNESNSAPSISISSAVGGGVTFAGISTFHSSVNIGGNLGIGTETPGSPLEVNGGSALDVATFNSHNADGPLINVQRSGTAIGFVGSGKNLHSATGSIDALALRSQAELTIATGGATERLRITAGGNVNIGGNFTETSHQLNISDSTKPSLCLHTGTTQRADFSATTGITSIRSFSNSPFTINIGGSGETEAFRITGDGNFGFGTNTPSQTSSGRTVLSIDGTANSLLNFSHGGTLTGFIYGANDEFRFESNDTKPLVFRTAGGTALTIDANAKLILPTGSTGIQFGSPDNPAASGGNDISSQTLDDYEEGTWTPTVTAGYFSTAFTTSGTYTKIGNLVTIQARLQASVNGNMTINTSSVSESSRTGFIQGMPFGMKETASTTYVRTYAWGSQNQIKGLQAGIYPAGSYNTLAVSQTTGAVSGFVFVFTLTGRVA